MHICAEGCERRCCEIEDHDYQELKCIYCGDEIDQEDIDLDEADKFNDALNDY
jgi:hypothetical protein